MLEDKNISPLLDNLMIGDPISDHHGICCCPAIHKENDKRYILKIISVPASQTQLNALLLTGAVENLAAAREYFENRVRDYTSEIDILQSLSRFEGFLSYEGYQVVAKDEETGFDIYILSQYQRTLEQQFTKKSFTKLDAVNLGLDICSALTACRRNGYIFVNLKPSNIYVAENGEYKICDFGFVKLDGLKYATIADHHIGEFTPPEITDPFSALNDRMDVYALGMILYKIYNGGKLPSDRELSLEAPVYADAEMAQIILKACSNCPDDRWQSPAEMGQMLVAYMQKNGIEDIPIVPAEPEPIPAAEEDEILDPVFEEAEVTSLSSETEVSEDSYIQQDEAVIFSENEVYGEQLSLSLTDTPPDGTASDDENAVIPAAQEAFVDEALISDTQATQAASAEPVQYDGVSDEVNEILTQADSLAAMEVPEPVISPEAPEIEIPPTPEETEDINQDEEDEPQMEYYINVPDEPKKSHWLRNLILILLLLGLLAGGFLFYKFYILKSISYTVENTQDQLIVTIDTDADETLLSVSCTRVGDSRETITVPVVDGKASFSGLASGSQYVIEFDISGLHLLDFPNNEKKYTYYTPSEIVIDGTEVLAGIVPGDAVLNVFASVKKEGISSIDADTLRWRFTYSASGIAENTVCFEGAVLTLSGLNEGTIYKGLLELENDALICEPLEIEFTPSEIIKANDLIITSCADGKLTAQWSAPEAVQVESWKVRCYNDRSYDETITTASTTAEFTGLDSTNGFTVEVTAVGQSSKQTASVAAGSITVSNITADTKTPGIIGLKWDSSSTPANGWVITCNAEGCESVVRVNGDTNEAYIKPAVPGVSYTISIRADSVQTLCADFLCTVPETEDYKLKIGDETLNRDSFSYSLCVRPDEAVWDYEDVAAYTRSFKLSDNGAIVMFLDSTYKAVDHEISVAYVVYDSEDQIISIDSQLLNWNTMWVEKHAYLDIPKLPGAVGKYNIALYFNGTLVLYLPFTVS